MGLCRVFRRIAAVAPGAVVRTADFTILPFPCTPNAALRRALQKDLLRALQISGFPVIVNLSGCPALNHDDIDCLLECVAEAAGRDTRMLIVSGSSANRVLLEVTRIASLVRVFNSIEDALAYPQIATQYGADAPRTNQSEPLERAA